VISGIMTHDTLTVWQLRSCALKERCLIRLHV
jgi:hypothetical protein